MRRKYWLILVILFGAVVAYHYELIHYAFSQAKGQFLIIWNARPVAEYLEDPAVPDSVKQRLQFIAAVKRYAIDSLGLNDTENYTSMYDQQGKPVLWVVTGCQPYAFEPKEWDFPVIGKMPYKGFFNREAADKAFAALKAEGYDVSMRTVGGWSTLGWFNDPILSNMLERSWGELANLIIHELSHATIFVKDSVDFNENLASFIGDQGTYRFLASTYGRESEQYTTYVQEMEDEVTFSTHILHGVARLDSLYQTFGDSSDDQKALLKEQLIQHIMSGMDTLHFHNPAYRSTVKGFMPNNAYFMSFVRYRSKQDNLGQLYNERFKQDLPAFIAYLKDKHPFL